MWKHPSRYPVHAGDKGQVYAGTCNVTRCDNPEALWWNTHTFGYYCTVCARGINYNPNQKLCKLVDAQVTPEESDEMEWKYV